MLHGSISLIVCHAVIFKKLLFENKCESNEVLTRFRTIQL